MSSAKKISISRSKKKSKKKQKPEPPISPVLSKTLIVWDDAYPCVVEVFKYGKETFETRKYFSNSNSEIDKFLYDVIRSNCIPSFIKNNFKKIKKFIEKEIHHRDKLFEKLSKEQVSAFQSYFQDEEYFEKDETNEYFHHELEKVYFNYLKSYLDTALYESQVRSLNRKRLVILEQYGLQDGRF